mgnify:CR=1 FL=1
MATPPNGTKLSLGKLGRATNVGNSNNTSKTSLNSAGRDSGTGKTSLSDFYIGSVDNTLDGFPYVDEQTNEIYTMTFGDENSLFESRIASRHQNFTWTTSNSGLFAIQSNQDFTAQYNAGAIAEAANEGFISKSFEDNLVTDFDFNNWTTDNNLGNWTESGGSVIQKQSITTAPSSSNAFAVKFLTQGGSINQTFTVKGNSVYEIVAHLSSSNVGFGQIDLEVSGAFYQETFKGIAGNNVWNKFRDDFNTSGSNADQQLKLTFTAVSASSDHQPLLDSVFFRRWEGSNFSDQEVTISGKYHDAGQTDGFNDHATRYNTAIQKTVEIQDTYGGLAIACFLPGTLIQMADDTVKLIEEINVGDEVLSIDLPGLPDEDLGYHEWKAFTMRPMDNLPEMVVRNRQTATVEHLFYDYMNGYYDINNGFLKVTREHDLFIYKNGLWVWETPDNIKVGMRMFGHMGEVVNVSSVEWIAGEVEVINFDVEPLDVYFAGGVLVHNKGTSSDPG